MHNRDTPLKTPTGYILPQQICSLYAIYAGHVDVADHDIDLFPLTQKTYGIGYARELADHQNAVFFRPLFGLVV